MFGTRVFWKQSFIVVVLLMVALGSRLPADREGREQPAASDAEQIWLDKSGDEELAYLLVKLEKQTRKVIAGHYGREQAGTEETAQYKEFLIRNRILPAAVADPIFAEVVPGATGGRAWVKMVVPEPRNPNNRGDSVSLEMLEKIKHEGTGVWHTTDEACYYGEPITAKPGCLPCHGAPKADPDPYFPQYKKNGWEPGEVVGAVIARVEPEN